MPAIEHTVFRKTLFESPWSSLEAPGIDYVPATTACFSPDGGRYCAVGTYDGRVLVWDFQTLRIVVRVLEKPSIPDDGSSSTKSGRVRCLAWGRGRLDGQWQLTVGYEASTVKASPENANDSGSAARSSAFQRGSSRVPCGLVVGWGLAEGKQLWSYRFDATPFSIACRWQWGTPTRGPRASEGASTSTARELFGGGWFVAASDNQCWLLSGGAAGISNSSNSNEALLGDVSAEVLFRDPDLPPEGSLHSSRVDKARLETAAVSFRPAALPFDSLHSAAASAAAASSLPPTSDGDNDQPEVGGLLYVYVGHTVVQLGEEVEPGAAAAAAAAAATAADAAASEAAAAATASHVSQEGAGEAMDDEASKGEESNKDADEDGDGADDASDSSTASSKESSGAANSLLALGTVADAARAKARAANVSNGPSFHVLRAERQPGHCSVNSLQMIDHAASFPSHVSSNNDARRKDEESKTAAASSGDAEANASAVNAGTVAKGEGSQGAYPRWIVAVCSLSVRLLDAQSLRCVYDLGNSQRKSKTLGKASAVWAAAAVEFLPLAQQGGGDLGSGSGSASVGSGGMGNSTSNGRACSTSAALRVQPAQQPVLVASLVNGDRGPERDLEGQHFKYLCLWHLPMEGDNPYSTNIVSVVSNPPSSSLASSNILSDKIISTRGKRGGTGSSAQMPPPPPPPIKRGSKAIERFDATTGEVLEEYQSGSACARALGVTQIEVSDTVHGKRTSAHGHALRFKLDNHPSSSGNEPGGQPNVVFTSERTVAENASEAEHERDTTVDDAEELNEEHDSMDDVESSCETDEIHEMVASTNAGASSGLRSGRTVETMIQSRPVAAAPGRPLAEGNNVRRKNGGAQGIVIRRNLAWVIVQFDEDEPGQTVNCRSGDLVRIYQGNELEVEAAEIAREMEERRAATAREAHLSGGGKAANSQSGLEKGDLQEDDTEGAPSRKRPKKYDEHPSDHAAPPPPLPLYHAASMRAPVQYALPVGPQMEMTLVAAPERRIRHLAFNCTAVASAGQQQQQRGIGGGINKDGGEASHAAQPMLMALSDVDGGSAFVLEASRSTNWAGCMYPPGFEVIEDNLPYLEAEDELDVPVDVSGQPLPWEDPEAHFTEDDDVDVTTTTTTIVQGGGGKEEGRDDPRNEQVEVPLHEAADSTQSGALSTAAAVSKGCLPFVMADPLCLEASAMRRLRKLTSSATDFDDDDDDDDEDDDGPDGTGGGDGQRPSRRNTALEELLAPRGFDDLLPASMTTADTSSSSMVPPTKKTFPGKGRWWARVPMES